VQELPQLGDDQSLLLAPIAARGDDKDSIYAWLEQLDKQRSNLEKGRLLYVAATRAERELHLFGVVESKEGILTKPRANSFLHLLWPSVQMAFAQQQTALTFAPTPSKTTSVIRTLRVPLAWTVPIPTGDYGETTLLDVIENEPLQPEFEWVSETGRHVGTLVHREIERIARVNMAAADVERHAARFGTELAELGVPPHLRSAASARVVEALTTMLGDERGRWLLSTIGTGSDMHREAASELALSGLVDGEIVNGVIDRTFLTQDGTRWIVDFKTSSHEGGGLEEFLASEVERYRMQLQRYATLMRGYRPNEPIKAALYFPLLKAWREVPV
jgi:ATP-dependent exoDNAse (exonuclease V) beta subunit